MATTPTTTAAPHQDLAAGQRTSLVALFLSMFISSIGTTLLLIGVSITYLHDTGLVLSAGLVYVAQYLPPVCLTSVVARLCQRTPPRALLVTVELLSLTVSVGVGLLFKVSYAAVFLLLVVRGFLDMTLKAGRGVAVKRYFPPDRLQRANTLLNAGYYLGAAVGSLAGVLIVARLTMLELALVDAATFLAAAAVYLMLRPLCALGRTTPDESGAWRRSRRVLKNDARLATTFGYLVLSVVLFQGINQTLRVWLPLQWIGMPVSGGAWSEAVGLAGVLTGLGVVAWTVSHEHRRLRLAPVFVLTLCLMTSTLLSRDAVAVFAAYFAFMAGFEVLYTKSFNDLLATARQPDVPALVSAFYGLAFAGMAVSVAVTGTLADHVGMPSVVLGVAGLGLPCALFLERRGRRERRTGGPGGEGRPERPRRFGRRSTGRVRAPE
ncbi:MFS transporter [Streptomyces chrestomyceticus]|uniref:MFS transporter n=1 Tax=Streptomyces chrestomyceticus TaxID=68185 RepID=UPI0033CC4B8A